MTILYEQAARRRRERFEIVSRFAALSVRYRIERFFYIPSHTATK